MSVQKIINLVVVGYIGFKKDEDIRRPKKYYNKKLGRHVGESRYRAFLAITNEEKERIEVEYNKVRANSFHKDDWAGMSEFFKSCNENADLEKYPHLRDCWNISASTRADYPPKFLAMLENGKARYIHPEDEYDIPSGSLVKLSLGMHAYEQDNSYGIACYFNGLLLIEKPIYAIDMGEVFGVEVENEAPKVIENSTSSVPQKRFGRIGQGTPDPDIDAALSKEEESELSGM